ncbi:hypothetical protein DPMN_183403 [Dreissena polymorpha]|uniref:Uncharacterized protein n=2 Tax=Dreissena polymorpha TaxID=45954 RepID=A0A9D4I5H4_DREPO|nr:hypothetical protein DPMN_183403 [Dreissena polymorpha]
MRASFLGATNQTNCERRRKLYITPIEAKHADFDEHFCAHSEELDYPPVARTIVWSNFIPPAICVIVVCFTLCNNRSRIGPCTYLVSVMCMVISDTILFINCILFVTLVGPAVGFKASELTLNFYMLAVVSGLLPSLGLKFLFVRCRMSVNDGASHATEPPLNRRSMRPSEAIPLQS